jgi:hypothetical protein
VVLRGNDKNSLERRAVEWAKDTIESIKFSEIPAEVKQFDLD